MFCLRFDELQVSVPVQTVIPQNGQIGNRRMGFCVKRESFYVYGAIKSDGASTRTTTLSITEMQRT